MAYPNGRSYVYLAINIIAYGIYATRHTARERKFTPLWIAHDAAFSVLFTRLICIPLIHERVSMLGSW